MLHGFQELGEKGLEAAQCAAHGTSKLGMIGYGEGFGMPMRPRNGVGRFEERSK